MREAQRDKRSSGSGISGDGGGKKLEPEAGIRTRNGRQDNRITGQARETGRGEQWITWTGIKG